MTSRFIRSLIALGGLGAAAIGCSGAEGDYLTSSEAGASWAAGGTVGSYSGGPTGGVASATGGSTAVGGDTGQGGTIATGGVSTGGTTASSGGFTVTGGVSTGGTTASSGGFTATGGVSAGGTTASSGGFTATGGETSTGGFTATGGETSTGGFTATGGETSTGGFTATGGETSTGGFTATGGETSTGGFTATGGETSTGGTDATGGAGGGTGAGECRVMLEGATGEEPDGLIPVCCTPTADEKANIDAVFQLLNDYRIASGLSALANNTQLEETIQGHCRHMAAHSFFDHTAPESVVSSPWDRAELCGTSANGENIAMGYRSPEEVMTGWQNSDGHNRNMLGSSWSEVGIGEHENYWGQIFR